MDRDQVNDQTDIGGTRFTGYHMAICMVLFFSVIIAVNLTMAVIASKSWTGLVVKNSYVASQEFNEKLAVAEHQHALGWRSTLKYQSGTLAFSIRDEVGNPILADTVTIKIGRPAFEQEDKTLSLTSDQIGTFSIGHHLEPGDWSLQIDAFAGGKNYRRDARIDVSANGIGVVE